MGDTAVELAYMGNGLGMALMVPVGHVQAHHVHTGSIELLDHGQNVGRRAEGTDEFCFAHDYSRTGVDRRVGDVHDLATTGPPISSCEHRYLNPPALGWRA